MVSHKDCLAYIVIFHQLINSNQSKSDQIKVLMSLMSLAWQRWGTHGHCIINHKLYIDSMPSLLTRQSS